MKFDLNANARAHDSTAPRRGLKMPTVRRCDCLAGKRLVRLACGHTADGSVGLDGERQDDRRVSVSLRGVGGRQLRERPRRHNLALGWRSRGWRLRAGHVRGGNPRQRGQ